MLRLADLIARAEIAAPQRWIYNFGRVGEPVSLSETQIERAREEHAVYANRLRQSQVYAVDSAAAYFLKINKSKPLDQVQDFPCFAMPFSHLFLEMFAPRGSDLPPAWGWFVTKIDRDAVTELLARRTTPVANECSHGLVWNLALGGTSQGAWWSMFPALTVVVQIGGLNDLIVAPPITGFPFAVDSELVANVAGLYQLVELLLHTGLFALSVLNHQGNTPVAVRPTTPRKQGKRPPSQRQAAGREYWQVRTECVENLLRTTGLAGIGGLANALRVCRNDFGKPNFAQMIADSRWPDPQMSAQLMSGL